MKQKSQILPRNFPTSSGSEEKRTLMQAIEEVLRNNGLEPKWDYSKAGQSVMMPTGKRHGGKA